MNSQEIKHLMQGERIYQWEVAKKLGISEFTLVRWLRDPISEDHQLKIENAINALLDEQFIKDQKEGKS